MKACSGSAAAEFFPFYIGHGGHPVSQSMEEGADWLFSQPLSEAEIENMRNSNSIFPIRLRVAFQHRWSLFTRGKMPFTLHLKTGRCAMNAWPYCGCVTIVPTTYISLSGCCVIFICKRNQHECSSICGPPLSGSYLRIHKLFPSYSWAIGRTSVSLLIMVVRDNIDRRRACHMCRKYFTRIPDCFACICYISKVKSSWKRDVEKYFLFGELYSCNTFMIIKL
jgi:hypothetical protein